MTECYGYLYYTYNLCHSVLQCLHMYENYSNSQKFHWESCKAPLSFYLFLYLLIFMNSASQIVQLTFFQTLLVLPNSCLSSNLIFCLECAFSPSLSSEILLILWGMAQVSSSRRHAIFMSLYEGIYAISLSHCNNLTRNYYYAFFNRWKYETLKKCLLSKGIIRSWLWTQVSLTPWVPSTVA